MIDVLPVNVSEGSRQRGRMHTEKAPGSLPSGGSKPRLDKLSLFPALEPAKKSSSMIRPRSVGPASCKAKVCVVTAMLSSAAGRDRLPSKPVGRDACVERSAART